MSTKQNTPLWLKLDNAAKIFPPVISDELTAVFRIGAVLKDKIKIYQLHKALLNVEKRFPYFRVVLRRGFFWYYLEHSTGHIPVVVDREPVCRGFENGQMLIRILVRDRHLSMEVSHVITDGSGALEFFKTLLIEYTRELGMETGDDFMYISPESEVLEQEWEDSYKKYFNEAIPPAVKRSKAFHLPFPLAKKPRFRYTIAMISTADLKAVAKKYNVTITVYLVAVYLFILQEFYEELMFVRKLRRRPVIRMQVPVNLRKILSSRTMRNFSLFVMPEIDMRLGHYSFDEILRIVYHQMQLETEEKLLNKIISRNVRPEKIFFIRAIPLFIKNAILRMKYYSLGTKQYSGVISNLGLVKLPEATSELIDYLYVILPPPNKMLRLSCGVIAFEDKLTLTFGNITKNRQFEQRFMLFLEKDGIKYQIIKN